jgi:hypothetical protein
MNGWKNYQTWNVALWIGADEFLYAFARKSRNWTRCVRKLESIGYDRTPDGVLFRDKRVSRREMTEMLKEL